jgi:two-component system, NarL family, nitrate/nitrite response regulator NarL
MSVVSKTLLIDDSEIDLFIQRRFLEVYNFSTELITYKSASQALQWLRKTDPGTSPELIFLDLNMPEMDGFGFLKEFLTLPEPVRQKSRIVILTSSNSAKDRELAMNYQNVIRFITKPLKQSDIEELAERLTH